MEPARARVPLSQESMAFVARLDAAEAAVRRGDDRAAVHLLHRAPSLLQGSDDGRVLELMALCAGRSALPLAGDPWVLWHKCLAAYQDSQDARGMERAHRGVGLWAFGRGELHTARQELHRAQRLLPRDEDPHGALTVLCSQAEVALCCGREAMEDAYRFADAAVADCQNLQGTSLLQARARLLRAQALSLMGALSEAALDLLWAERMAAPSLSGGAAAMGTDELQLLLCRSESLLMLGHPRRAATCLSGVESLVLRIAPEKMLARYRLLVGQAWLNDQPHAAHAAALLAQRYYAARKLHYLRTQCDIALLRSAYRLGHSDTHARLRALLAAKLERWPLVSQALRAAQQEVNAPQHHALGAVKTPWMRAVGKIDMQTSRQHSDHQADVAQQHEGLLARLHHAMRGHDDKDPHHTANLHKD